MFKWVARYMKTSDVCQCVSSARHASVNQSLLASIDCWRLVALDFIFVFFENADGHNGVLVFVGKLSKMVRITYQSDSTGAEGSVHCLLIMFFAITSYQTPSSRTAIHDSLVAL
ncbi:hypothetical protein Plhal304r1_c007g0028821 [Plasmopara halstedii]